jgi:hypothetical protein
MPENTRTVRLIGSNKLAITSASFETALGMYECERVQRSGVPGGDYVLECDQLPTERPIRRVHITAAQGEYTCEVPERLWHEWSFEIRV